MWTLAWAWYLWSIHLVFALSGEEIAKHLRSSLSPESSIYLPSDPQWQMKALQPWNQWRAPKFTVSVQPKQQEDVQKVVRYAKQHNVPFFTMGGGHGYSGTRNKLDGGIQIDMGNFKSVIVDPTNNTLTIGGSVRFRDLAGPVYAAKKSIVVGACSCVGMTGATLGGGIGFFSGLYGAISDSLVSLTMVTGSGDIVTVSESKNSDLLWGMRGAGFNFGTVTSLTYKIYDYPNHGQAMNTDMLFPISQNGSVWEVVKSFFATQIKELSIAVGLMFDPVSQQVIMAVNTIYLRPVEEGKKFLQPFFDLNPMNTNISYLPWKDVPDTALYGGIAKNCRIRPFYVPYTANLHNLDVSNMMRIVKYFNDTVPSDPRLQGSLVTLTQYASWGFEQRAANYSAFPHRKPTIFAQFDGIASSMDDASAVDSLGKRVRELFNQRNSGGTMAVYTHFAHGDEGPKAWYTEDNLPYLRELKIRFDPNSVFSYYNPIY